MNTLYSQFPAGLLAAQCAAHPVLPHDESHYYSYDVAHINLDIFLQGRVQYKTSLRAALVKITRDPYIANIINQVFNNLPYFKIEIKDSFSASDQNEISNSQAYYTPNVRTLYLRSAMLASSGQEILSILRHEFTHAWWHSLHLNGVTSVTDILADDLQISDSGELLRVERRGACYIRGDKKHIKIMLAEVQLAIKKMVGFLNGKQNKTLVSQFEDEILPRAPHYKKLGYYHIVAIDENRKMLLSGAPSPTLDGYIHPRTKVVYRADSAPELPGMLDCPVSVLITAFSILSILAGQQDRYPPEKNAYLFLSELQAVLVMSLPYQVLQLFLPELMRLYVATEPVTVPLVYSVTGYQYLTSIANTILHHDPKVMPEFQVLDTLRCLGEHSSSKNIKVLEKAIEICKELIQRPTLKHRAHLYAGRIYFNIMCLKYSSISAAEKIHINTQMTAHYKQVLKYLPQLSVHIYFTDISKHIGALQELAKDKQDVSYIHTAQLVCRKLLNAFASLPERSDSAELNAYLERASRTLQRFRKIGLSEAEEADYVEV
jgi:hypothetical protein